MRASSSKGTAGFPRNLSSRRAQMGTRPSVRIAADLHPFGVCSVSMYAPGLNGRLEHRSPMVTFKLMPSKTVYDETRSLEDLVVR